MKVYSQIPDQDKVIIGQPDETGMFDLTFFAFSTVITVKAGTLIKDDGALIDKDQVANGVVDLCRRFEWLLSRTLEGSDIYNINHSQGGMVEVAKETAQAIMSALEYCERSKGYFDITMGSVTQLWDFHEGIIPDQKDIDEALSHVNWRNVDFHEVLQGDEAHYFIRLLDPDAVLDLGGSAKGFIADKICAYLISQGIVHGFVNLGGNVAVFGGKPDRTSWRIGIKNPFNKEQIRGVMSLYNGSVVTSGLYERCFTKDDVFYHHILDVRTGYPIETDIAGVSVIANKSRDADGFSTTLFALGCEEALKFVQETPEIEAIIVTKDERTIRSKGLDNYAK